MEGGLAGWRAPGWMETGWRGLTGWMEGAWLDGGVWKEGGQELDACGWKVFEREGVGWRDGWSGSAVRFARFVSRVGSAVCGFLRFTGLNGSWRFSSGLRFGSRPSCFKVLGNGMAVWRVLWSLWFTLFMVSGKGRACRVCGIRPLKICLFISLRNPWSPQPATPKHSCHETCRVSLHTSFGSTNLSARCKRWNGPR